MQQEERIPGYCCSFFFLSGDCVELAELLVSVSLSTRTLFLFERRIAGSTAIGWLIERKIHEQRIIGNNVKTCETGNLLFVEGVFFFPSSFSSFPISKGSASGINGSQGSSNGSVVLSTNTVSISSPEKKALKVQHSFNFPHFLVNIQAYHPRLVWVLGVVLEVMQELRPEVPLRL